MNTPPPSAAAPWPRFKAATVRGFHSYANWLVGIGWRRFVLLSLLLLIAAGILQNLPPFSWRVAEHVETRAAKKAAPEHAKPGATPRARYEIKIDESGVHIGPIAEGAAASGAAAGSAASAASAAPAASTSEGGVHIVLPAEGDREDIHQAIEDAIAEARGDAAHERIVSVTLGDYLPQLAFLWIIASAILKITYKGRLQAEVKAAQATETAEAESLKRQVIEARLAAMQAQVEPHFLFNTLASIDHLIETDPPRASAMQKNLIAMLRASMPSLRESTPSGLRDLGAELAVITPYLEILKVRMEERLRVQIDVPEGLRSAAFPPMMIQSLVENAIKHGLEPKAEGGELSVRAQIVHGKLAVSVADTGLGYGRGATSGTGTGLTGIRERLQLLYGLQATLTIGAHTPSGTVVTVTVPYVAQPRNDTGNATTMPA